MRRAALVALLIAVTVPITHSAQPEPGAPLDPAAFAFRRTIPNGPPGVVALIMDAFALAHSQGPGGRFSDVRILDSSSHQQVPYVIEHRDQPMPLSLTADRADLPVSRPEIAKRTNWSNYRLRLPVPNLSGAQLVLETSAHVFRRGVEIAVVRQPDRHTRNARLAVIATATWVHVDPEEPAGPLTVTVVPSEASELWLSIDEGDNSALPITAVRLLLPSYRLRFYRPAESRLLLVYGRNDLAPPRYDLALLSRDVLNADAVEVTALGEQPATVAHQPLLSPMRFWFFLAIAAAVLLALIVRLVRRTESRGV